MISIKHIKFFYFYYLRGFVLNLNNENGMHRKRGNHKHSQINQSTFSDVLFFNGIYIYMKTINKSMICEKFMPWKSDSIGFWLSMINFDGISLNENFQSISFTRFVSIKSNWFGKIQDIESKLNELMKFNL